jgi:hypothetical protein
MNEKMKLNKRKIWERRDSNWGFLDWIHKKSNGNM